MFGKSEVGSSALCGFRRVSGWRNSTEVLFAQQLQNVKRAVPSVSACQVRY